MSDLANRALAYAEHARAKPDPKRLVMERCPEFVAFVRTLNAAIDGRVTLLRAWDADGYCYGEPDRGRWLAVSAPQIKETKRGMGKRN